MKLFEDLYSETTTTASFTIGDQDKPGRLFVMSRYEDQGRVYSWGAFAFDGAKATLWVGDLHRGNAGKIVLGTATSDDQSILIDGETCGITLGGQHAGNGRMTLKTGRGAEMIDLDAEHANVVLGGNGEDGDVIIRNAGGEDTIVLNGSGGALTLGGGASNGTINIKDASGSQTAQLGAAGNLVLGGGNQDGDLVIKSASGNDAIVLAGSAALVTVGGVGTNGDIVIKNSNDIETIKIYGSNGDIEFLNADVAEEFEVGPEHYASALPGAVMVVGADGTLAPCETAYDSRVVGIVAGGGRHRPGIVLDKNGGERRRPIALVGKVYCLVDADTHPIEVGDLLTTSARRGHAMRIADRDRAFGSIVGKALAPVSHGTALIPVLVKPVLGREIAKVLARKFNLKSADEATFDRLWHFIRESRDYQKSQRDQIERDRAEAYKLAAHLANGEDLTERTFDRARPRDDHQFVIFSDLHMTAFDGLPNYFKDFNYALYLDVLDYYSRTDFCLVENGDVEECIVYEPDFDDAAERKRVAPKAGGIDEIAFPIRPSDSSWSEFLDLRYAKRRDTLDRVIAEFGAYYDLLRTRFIPRDKYVRLTGNHDTYLGEEHERTLQERIESVLGIPVRDALQIERDGRVEYLVIHGHQFDSACMQHGSVPYAKSLGEIFSECLSWAYMGADRVWTLSDTKKWYIGNRYQNVLAREEHGTYKDGKLGWWDLITSDQWDLLAGSLDDIKSDSKDFVETLLGTQIAWEYFENSEGPEAGLHALTLEVWTGDEMYKMKHMNEVDLCSRYVSEFINLRNPPDFTVRIPKLVLGHTHEPRQNAVVPAGSGPDNGDGSFYLNSGSAGRYENLIWCVEIVGSEDRICSWSRMDGKLKKITWKSEGGSLVHDSIEWISTPV